MTSGDGEPNADAVVFGGGHGRRTRPWILYGVAIVVAAVVVGLVFRQQTGPAARPTPPGTSHPTPTATPTQSSDSTPSTSHSTPAPAPEEPKVTSADLSWLHPSSDWELFARTDSSVVRIQAGNGRVTQTFVPTLQSSGPVSFLVRRGAAFVHPMDYVPGYVVPDGRPARPSGDRLPDGGLLLPGPEPDQIWVERGEAGARMYHLLKVSDDPTGVSIDPPQGASGLAWPDGDGYLLMAGTGGVYDLGRGEPMRVTTGTVVATGPTTMVVSQCDAQADCRPRLEVVDQDSGDRRRLPGKLATTNLDRGKTSPDGSMAAVLVLGPEERPRNLVLIDLGSGRTARVDVELPRNGSLGGPWQSAMAWSPDGRWLFVVAADGSIEAVNPQTGEARRLQLHLDDTVLEIAARP